MRDLRGALGVLRAVARAGQGKLSAADVLARVCREIGEGYGFDRVSISRLDEQRGLVLPVAAHGIDEDELRNVRLALGDS